METPSGTSDEETNTDTPQTDETDENATSDTSEDGSQESTDKKQLADKDRYIKELETDKKKLQAKVDKTNDPSEIFDWKVDHLDEIKMGGEVYKKEVQFFKDQGIKITPAILEKALEVAKNTKGMSDEPKTADDATTTAAPAASETRATKADGKKKSMPDWLKRSGTMTQERWDEEVANKEAERAGK